MLCGAAIDVVGADGGCAAAGRARDAIWVCKHQRSPDSGEHKKFSQQQRARSDCTPLRTVPRTYGRVVQQVLTAERRGVDAAADGVPAANVYVVAPCPHDGEQLRFSICCYRFWTLHVRTDDVQQIRDTLRNAELSILQAAAPWTALTAGAISYSASNAQLCRSAPRCCLVRLARTPVVQLLMIVAPPPATTSAAGFIQVQSHSGKSLPPSRRFAGGARPRDYQDERFSYVALRRRPRPAVPAGLRLQSSAGTASADAQENAELFDEKAHEDGSEVSHTLCYNSAHLSRRAELQICWGNACAK